MTIQNRKSKIENRMGLYSKHIFPRFLDWSLGNATLAKHRLAALAPLRGHVLEIGFGTGLNLPFFPREVTRLTAIDSKQMLPKKVAKRIAEARMPVECLQLDAGVRLPLDSLAFDGVVTTFTLCSIAHVHSALHETRRVLKPEGQYVFLEHGRSDDPRIARRQDFFNPVQKVIGCGCNLNRKIDDLIRESGFEIVKLERYLMADVPRILGETYQGIARRSADCNLKIEERPWPRMFSKA
jgi:ubiquinone/menaquinone biosynthesis C-methylase UbiE